MNQELRDALPETISPDEIRAHFTLRTGVSSTLGESLLLWTDRVRLFTREFRSSPFEEIELDLDSPPVLVEDGYNTTIELKTPDKRPLVLEVSILERDECRSFMDALSNAPSPASEATVRTQDQSQPAEESPPPKQPEPTLEAAGPDRQEPKPEPVLDESVAAADSADDELQELVQLYLEQGQKIQAIKEVREHTGMGLKEAKDYVDALEAGEPSMNHSGHGGGNARVTLILWAIMITIFIVIYNILSPKS